MTSQEEYLRKMRDYQIRKEQEAANYQLSQTTRDLKAEIEAVNESATPWEDFTVLEERVGRIEAFLRKKFLEEWDSFEV